MDRWIGKIAVVTGASSGIGAAIVLDLVRSGMIVIGLARRQERIDDLKKLLTTPADDVNKKNSLYSFKCDVSNEADIKSAFLWIINKFGGIDVLINNAGIIRQTQLIEPNNTEKLKQILDTNVMGVALCTREAYQSMKSRNINGHIIVINSICGHYIPRVDGVKSMNMYPSSKYAVTAMVEVLRREFLADGSKTKISSISPGLVKTEIVPKELLDMPNVCALESEDISAGVLYVLSTPPHVQVHELTIKPVGEIF